MTVAPPIVLASASPRRAEILRRLGLSFQVQPSQVNEALRLGESPREQARRLAEEKAREVHAGHPHALVLGGDTIVVLDRRILGKPENREEAATMLLGLSGRTHEVVSGLALCFPDGSLRAGVAVTRVTFRRLDEDLVRRYVRTGEPMDKAGAYGIQGLGSALVDRIDGDYHAVVGLPISVFLDLLEDGGWRYAFGAIVPGPIPSR